MPLVRSASPRLEAARFVRQPSQTQGYEREEERKGKGAECGWDVVFVAVANGSGGGTNDSTETDDDRFHFIRSAVPQFTVHSRHPLQPARGKARGLPDGRATSHRCLDHVA